MATTKEKKAPAATAAAGAAAGNGPSTAGRSGGPMSPSAPLPAAPAAPAPAAQPAAAPAPQRPPYGLKELAPGVPDRSDEHAVALALAEPFSPDEVKFKPQTVAGNRALAVPYVDARVIQDRLDDVLGVMGWQDSYERWEGTAVLCRLRIRLGAEWITKEDVGGQSEQPDEGDRRKAALSDALKRAAVKVGIGRYLYRMKPQWVDWDPQKRQFVRMPSLPPAPDTVAEKKAQPPSTPAASSRRMPANGAELAARLCSYEATLVAGRLCEPGELVGHVARAGRHAGHAADLTTWDEHAILLAIEVTRSFEAERRQRAASKASAG